ncbi:hypothetical protein AMELA_G00208420 [Ameiurus melas]|uniref:PARP catalytic domain-containing protein n=1 Tax=Ameiurus melas TaxID=219545 RepID=A0A7J6A3X8_AMEME|nr:hypothetical protein AMELA_G00208420 [Ameiurus melas]
MWAEDDLGPGVPCLESFSEPTDGKVYRMYHGTSRQAADQIMRTGFKQSAGGMLGRGVYLSRDLNKASRYPLDLPETQRVVIRVRVNVGKVKKIDRQGHRMQKTWHDHGTSSVRPDVPLQSFLYILLLTLSCGLKMIWVQEFLVSRASLYLLMGKCTECITVPLNMLLPKS